MKKLINLLLAGKSINTSEGVLTFDDNGVCVLEDETADAFKNVRGFVVENDAENNDSTGDEKDPDKAENPSENDPNTLEGDTDDSTDETTDDENKNTDDENKNTDDENKNTDEEVDLNSLSVPSLKKYAKEQGIDITGLTTKEPLIKAIKEAIQK